jgi:signal transduction histidine kinase
LNQTIKRVVWAYGAAIAATAAATGLRLALAPWVGAALPFFTYIVATLVVAWYFGIGPALLNIALSVAAGWYFFVSHTTTSPFYIGSSTDRITILGYVIVGVAASFLLDLQRKTLEKVRREVSRRQATERELLITNSALARSNEDLERFAFAASHDLQEPLRMVTAYSRLLAQRYSDQLNDDARVLIDNIVDSATRMRELIADLLAYTQVGSEPQRPGEVADLNKILEHVKANLTASIAETGASITAGQLPILQGHAVHFTSLFQNLISNAIKYRGEDPPCIRISAQQKSNEWQFAVVDNGIGIDPEYHDQIFEVFKRLHSRAIPGTGLGLATCKRIVESYGGRIWVESRAGQGSTFFFVLPELAVHAPQEPRRMGTPQ